MDIKAWLRLHIERLEVSIDSMLGAGTKGLFEKMTKPLESVRIVGEAELVAVSVLLLHVHEVVQGDQVGLVVDIEDTGLDILDVAAVVVDVLGRRLAIGKDVVIVAVINYEDSSRLDHVTEVLEALYVISLISMEIRKMSEGIPHANNSIKPSLWFLNIVLQCEPVSLLNDPVLEPFLLPPLPPSLMRNLEHLVRSIRRCHVESFLQQHDRVHPSTTSSVQNSGHSLLPQKVNQECLIVLGPGRLVTNIKLPNFSSLSIRILVCDPCSGSPKGPHAEHSVNFARGHGEGLRCWS